MWLHFFWKTFALSTFWLPLSPSFLKRISCIGYLLCGSKASSCNSTFFLWLAINGKLKVDVLDSTEFRSVRFALFITWPWRMMDTYISFVAPPSNYLNCFCCCDIKFNNPSLHTIYNYISSIHLSINQRYQLLRCLSPWISATLGNQ